MIFIDMDGVCADFDAGIENLCGMDISKESPWVGLRDGPELPWDDLGHQSPPLDMNKPLSYPISNLASITSPLLNSHRLPWCVFQFSFVIIIILLPP